MKTKLFTTFALCALYAATSLAQYAQCPYDTDVKDAKKKLNFTPSDAGVTFVTDASRGAVAEFDGTAGYITADPAKIYNFAAITINIWFQWNTTVANQWWVRIWDFGWDTNTGNINHDVNFLTLYQAGFLTWHIHPRAWTNGIDTILSSKDTIKLNKWYMLTATHASDSAKLFLDGVLQDKRGTAGVAPSAFDSLVTCYFGKSNWPDPLFTGKLDDLRIYNSVLSESEVLALYNDTKTSINTVKTNNDLNIYSKDSRIFINLRSTQIKNVAVYDITGRIISNLRSSAELSMQQFKSGIYIVRVSGVNQSTYASKIIVR